MLIYNNNRRILYCNKPTLNNKRKSVKKPAEIEFILMAAHPGHDKHLCHIVVIRNMKTLDKYLKMLNTFVLSVAELQKIRLTISCFFGNTERRLFETYWAFND
jgi:hypothetical protein